MNLSRLDPRVLGRRLRQNLLLRLFSLAFAIGLWGFVNLGERDAEKTLVVPLVLRNVPDSLVVTQQQTNVVDVRLRGSRTLLGTLDERRQGIELDLSNVRPGRTEFKIDESRLTLPRGVQTIRVSPSQVVLEVDRLVERSTPVVLHFDGDPPDGYRVLGSEVAPRRVTVSGPASVVDRLQEVHTEPVAVRPRVGATSMVVPLRRDDPQLTFRPARVEVRLQIEEIVGDRRFDAVPIEAIGAAEGTRLVPPTAEVSIRGPERVLRGLDRNAVMLRVDVGDLAAGAHPAEIDGQVPVGIEITKIEPRRIEVRVPAKTAGNENPKR